jgi:hypothetical protein
MKRHRTQNGQFDFTTESGAMRFIASFGPGQSIEETAMKMPTLTLSCANARTARTGRTKLILT